MVLKKRQGVRGGKSKWIPLEERKRFLSVWVIRKAAGGDFGDGGEGDSTLLWSSELVESVFDQQNYRFEIKLILHELITSSQHILFS
jgi:hypothetical protein